MKFYYTMYNKNIKFVTGLYSVVLGKIYVNIRLFIKYVFMSDSILHSLDSSKFALI